MPTKKGCSEALTAQAVGHTSRRICSECGELETTGLHKTPRKNGYQNAAKTRALVEREQKENADTDRPYGA